MGNRGAILFGVHHGRIRSLISAVVALPWLLATVGASVRACPDHGDGAHSAHMASHATHASHDSRVHHAPESPAAPSAPHECTCPGASCCDAAAALAVRAPVDLIVADVAECVGTAAPPVTWAPAGHDTLLPFANGPPLSA